MIDITTQFIQRLKGISLSSNERLALRERLVAYAMANPVLLEDSASESSGLFSFFGSRGFSRYAVISLAVMVVCGGVSVAADGSVPGDSLYPIKISLNEPVMSALATSPTDQATIAAALATRRVDEAVTLATRGQLTPERQTYLAQQFGEHLKVAAKKTNELASTGDTTSANTVKANLAANLAGEAQALGAVTKNDTTQSGEFLRVVVATSENISDGGDVTIANSSENTTVASTTSSTSLTAGGTGQSSGLVSTSTPPSLKSGVTGRFSKHLHVDATVLRTHTNGTHLNTAGLLAPKTDVAIPQVTAPSDQSSVTETGGRAIQLNP